MFLEIEENDTEKGGKGNKKQSGDQLTLQKRRTAQLFSREEMIRFKESKE